MLAKGEEGVIFANSLLKVVDRKLLCRPVFFVTPLMRYLAHYSIVKVREESWLLLE